VRLLVSKLNRERKEQAKKIDILCNDLIGAQRDFIKRLDTIGFAVDFYESILGQTDLNNLLYTAARLIKGKVPHANVAFFLRGQGNFELHVFESEKPVSLEKHHLENCFTNELVNNICESNKVCTLNDMFAMGLQGNLVSLNKVSVATVPLGQVGSPLGFVLIYCSSQNQFTPQELNSIVTVAPGLSQAMQSCREFQHAAN
jgi:transcriptional regulator with GAF, ATPase, and Fis domain